MPELGEIKRAKDVGKASNYKYIWAACVDCGKARWVVLRHAAPQNLRCHPCIKLRGEQNGNWKGGICKRPDGYILLHKPEHPYHGQDGYVFEHRLVLEQELGRYLLPTEISHHLNSIRDDNRPENLTIYNNQSEHARKHSRECNNRWGRNATT